MKTKNLEGADTAGSCRAAAGRKAADGPVTGCISAAAGRKAAVYCRPMAEIVEVKFSSVLCESGDFRSGGTEEYDFGDTSDWNF